MCSQEAWGFTLPPGVDWQDVYSKPGGLLATWCCIPSFTVLLGRVCLLMVWIISTVWSLGNWVNEYDHDLKYWFIYLTHWGAMLELLYFIMLLLVTYLASCGCYDKDSGTPWFVSITWMLGTAMPAMTLVIFIFYWGLVYDDDNSDTDGSGPEPVQVVMHGLNYVLVLIDLLFTSQPLYFKHVWVPVIAGIIYSAFSYIYHIMDGRNATGDKYIYEALDWEHDPGKANAVVVIAIFVALPLLHGFHWVLATIRQLLACGNEEVQKVQPV